jgi:hypothetical protein
MIFIPAPGKVIYTQAKVYCPISLLSFMQKRMEKLVTTNIRDKILGTSLGTFKVNTPPINMGHNTESLAVKCSNFNI